MLLNIALILYVAVCLYLCLRNKKALYRFRGGGRQFTQSSKSGANTGESGFFLISGYSDTGVGATVGTLVADVGAVVIDTGCRHPIVGGYRQG